ncbi:helix-turn-helix transcriptional regulator [Gordonia terrae]
MRLTQARRRLFNDLIGIRERRGFSQAQVAKAIGIHRSGVSKFESDFEGSNPTLEVVLRYAHAVGASITMRAEPVETHDRRHEHRRVAVTDYVLTRTLAGSPKQDDDTELSHPQTSTHSDVSVVIETIKR